jgi:hypothetical protein
MGANFPGRSDLRSPCYFRVFDGSADVDLTSQVHQAQCACSGMVVTNSEATAQNLVITDASGEAVTFPIAAGSTVDIPVGAKALDADTGTLTILVYWHGSSPR